MVINVAGCGSPHSGAEGHSYIHLSQSGLTCVGSLCLFAQMNTIMLLDCMVGFISHVVAVEQTST